MVDVKVASRGNLPAPLKGRRGGETCLPVVE